MYQIIAKNWLIQVIIEIEISKKKFIWIWLREFNKSRQNRTSIVETF